jgi:hypothetical protein
MAFAKEKQVSKRVTESAFVTILYASRDNRPDGRHRPGNEACAGRRAPDNAEV